MDLTDKDMTGSQAAENLDDIGITVNKNLIPFDKRSASVTSGLRIGTPAVTTRGMRSKEMIKIAEIIDITLRTRNERSLSAARKEVRALAKTFPLYRDLIKDLTKA